MQVDLEHARFEVYDAPEALLAHCRRRPPRALSNAVTGSRDKGDVAALLTWLNERDAFTDYDSWFQCGMALKTEYGDSGLDLWELTHDDTVAFGEAEAKWESFSSDPTAESVTLATFVDRAHKMGWRGSVRKSTASMFDGVAQLAAAAGASLAPELLLPASTAVSLIGGNAMPADSEDSLALSFAAERADDLRYVEEWGRWMHWNGQAWTSDKTSSAYDMIRAHLRKFAGGMVWQEARKIGTAKTVAAVERMTRTDRRIVRTGDIWDADPWLLNTPGGVVDLRTGELRAANPDDHMTKMTAVTPHGDCPTWRAFLNKSLAGDVELIAFIQRVLGYALTGDTREHALFFMYGQGGNGKGVLLNTVGGIMGDYQKTAPVDTFIDSPHERHPTDLAGLRGARLVTASETEKGRRWAEAKIKMLTGGDRIAARFMRQDFFEFVPQFKLVIAGNHKPSLRSVDAAMRRRMHMIPFTVNIPESERDTGLPERLKAEWGGILAWLVEGCLAWQRGGLQPPAAVRAATDEYLSSEDVLGSWLDERCIQAAGNWASRQDLFMSWTRWAEGSREYVGTQKQFLDAMRQHGFEEGGRIGVRGFRGVQLKPPPVQP
jgi:putative DNA primase/helicase